MTTAPLSRSLKASLERATAAYQSQLDEPALAYLERRGLGSSLVTETHRLGVVRSPLPGHERFVGRLVIPYIGPKGNVYGMNLRCIEDHDCKEQGEWHHKYDKPAGMETRMFNTAALVSETDYIFVCEGELDAITLTACGWPAVAVAGVTHWRAHHSRMLAGFSRVVLLADGDDAGRKLADAVRRSLPVTGEAIVLSDGSDVNHTYMTGGKEALRALLSDQEDE